MQTEKKSHITSSAMMSVSSSSLSLIFLVALFQVPTHHLVVNSIGINYGRDGSNLPTPSSVVNFLAERTTFDGVAVYDPDDQVLSAFSASPLTLTITLPNSLIPYFTSFSFAKQWLQIHLLPHLPATNISLLLLGDEPLATSNRTLITSLVPALQSLHTALVSFSLHTTIRLSTPLSLSILTHSSPPSAARFRDGYDKAILRPLLSFLRATDAPLMINAYPYFGSSRETLDFALFRKGATTLVDEATQMEYTNMFDAQIDAVYSAMKHVDFGDIAVGVAKTGWPSQGDSWQGDANKGNAEEYVKGVMEHVNSGEGTPLMPNRTIETYVFSMFDEDMKSGPESERSFGVFELDLTPRYESAGLMRAAAAAEEEEEERVATTEKRWCVAKGEVEREALQGNMDYACAAETVDCSAIREGGACFFPDTVEGHAAFAMNEYYQVTGRAPFACEFGGTGVVTDVDPSYDSCKYRS